jgi:hypothetical protein
MFQVVSFPKFPYETGVCISLFPKAMPISSSSFERPNNIWQGLLTMQLFFKYKTKMEFWVKHMSQYVPLSPASCYFAHLTSSEFKCVYETPVS